MPEGTVIKIVSNLLRKKFREIGLRSGGCKKLIDKPESHREFRYQSSANGLMPICKASPIGPSTNKMTVVTHFEECDRVFFVDVRVMLKTDSGKETIWSRNIMTVGFRGPEINIQYIKQLPPEDCREPTKELDWIAHKIYLSDSKSLEIIEEAIQTAFNGWLAT